MLSIFSLAVVGAAAGLGYCYYRGACAHSAKREVKHEIKRWEDEGGNVPEVETPNPQAHAETSYPPMDTGMRPDIRH